MKIADVRAMSADQIDDEVLKLKKEQFNLRFQRATGQLENTSRVRVVRRDIARLKTIARQKNTGAEPVVAETAKPAKPAARKTRAKKAAAKSKAPRAKQKVTKSKKSKSKKK